MTTTHEHRCPTCGQEIPEALQTVTIPETGRDPHRNAEEKDALQTSRARADRNGVGELVPAPHRGDFGSWKKYAEVMRDFPDNPGSEFWWRERNGHEDGCVICGSDFPAHMAAFEWTETERVDRKYVSPKRRFCSNACRQRAYRTMKKLEQQTEAMEEN